MQRCCRLHLCVLNKSLAGGGNTRDPVENLSWTSPKNGKYVIEVNQFSRRETDNVGFSLEIECQGGIQQFSYAPAVACTIQCVSFDMHNGEMCNFAVLNKKILGGDLQTTKWGVTTESLVPVSTLMNSPNHWEGAGEVGNKHWIFVLDGCRNPDATRGIYNEFLRGDLEPHRKVFEVLASKTKCAPAQEQLSGVGFTHGRDDLVAVQVTSNNSTRVYNIKF